MISLFSILDAAYVALNGGRYHLLCRSGNNIMFLYILN